MHLFIDGDGTSWNGHCGAQARQTVTQVSPVQQDQRSLLFRDHESRDLPIPAAKLTEQLGVSEQAVGSLDGVLGRDRRGHVPPDRSNRGPTSANDADYCVRDRSEPLGMTRVEMSCQECSNLVRGVHGDVPPVLVMRPEEITKPCTPRPLS